jgi:DNA-binding beta-propeller fold protein YncE
MFDFASTRKQKAGVEAADPALPVARRRLVLGRLRGVGAVLGLAFVLAASATLAMGLSSGSSRRPSPTTGLLPNGRQLVPAGTRVTLGNLPTGGALTADGRFLWTVSAGVGNNDVRIVDTAHHRVCQVLPVPGASGGIALDSVHRLAYVSGLSVSLWLPTQFKLPGAEGNAVQVFSWTGTCGQARLVRVIKVPPQPGAPAPQAFPPNPSGTRLSWPEKLAVSPRGSRLLVALNLADSAAVVDLKQGDQVHYVTLGSGSYPFGAAITPNGRTGLVTNEGKGTMSLIDMLSATKTATIHVGAPLSHPAGVVVDSTGTRAYVALSNADQVAAVNLRTRRVVRTISVQSRFGAGTIPIALALGRSGARLFVAESGADALAVIRLPGKGTPAKLAWTAVGRVPTAEQPEAVLTSAANDGRASRLMWIAARGLDTGPLPAGPNPVNPNDPIFWAFHPIPPPTVDIFNQAIRYGAVVLRGEAGLMALPSDAEIAKLTPVANGELHPVGGQSPPANTPLRPGGPIKHIFFVVRENRSYDQMLGDVKRGDGDPRLLVFDRRVTPNLHSLVNRFPLLDNVLANSDASIQGHYWTSAATVPDYVTRNWVANYAGRFRPADFGIYAVARPAGGFLFDQAQRQHISYFNYGEMWAGISTMPDRNRTAAVLKEEKLVAKHSDFGPDTPAGGCYASDIHIGSVGAQPTQGEIFDSALPAGAPKGSYSHFTCFRDRFERQLAHNAVPTFNYLTFTNDHTRGTQPGYPTPMAMVAADDQGLGQVVALISHSKIWCSSAIFVVEDDSQDGADHLDAHREPALVISPYARRGVAVHTRYDLLSVDRSLELIMGMKPLGLNDALATPMYDVFSPTPVNGAPVNNIPTKINLLARNTPAAPYAAASSRLPLGTPDLLPQGELDSIIWKSVYGANSTPPPPGPNAGYDK